MKHLKYLHYLIKHKWFVLVAGLKIKAPLWRLLVHDWSKFLPSEWFPYVEHFYGAPVDSEGKEVRRQAFDVAWLHHQKRNPHHWQYWLLTNDSPGKAWSVTAHQPEVGPYYLATKLKRDGELRLCHVALFDVKHHLDGMSDEAYELSGSVAQLLNRAAVPQPMPESFIREMVADWCGAGRAITGEWDVAEWYNKNRSNIILHPSTRKRVEQLLSELDLMHNR